MTQFEWNLWINCHDNLIITNHLYDSYQNLMSEKKKKKKTYLVKFIISKINIKTIPTYKNEVIDEKILTYLRCTKIKNNGI